MAFDPSIISGSKKKKITFTSASAETDFPLTVVDPPQAFFDEIKENPFRWSNFDSSFTKSNDNLTIDKDSNDNVWRSTRLDKQVSTGKHYWEIKIEASDPNKNEMIGIAKSTLLASQYPGQTSDSYSFYTNGGFLYNNGTDTLNLGTGSLSDGDIVGVALDLDNGKMWFSVNGAWVLSGNPSAGTGQQVSGLSGVYVIAHGSHGIESKITVHPRSNLFAYTIPSGFSELGVEDLKKISVESGGVQCPVEIEPNGYDSDNNKFVFHAKIPSVVSGENEVSLSFDASQDDNNDYVGSVGGTPAKSVWSPTYHRVINPQEPSGTVYDSVTGDSMAVTGSMGALVSSIFGSGKAFDYDGANDVIATGLTSINSAGFSIETSLKFTSIANYGGVVDKYLGAGTGVVMDCTAGKIRFTVGGNAALQSSVALNDGTERYIAASVDQSEAFLYVNAVLDDSDTSLSAWSDNAEDLIYGADGASTLHFAHQSAFLRIAKRKLSANWINLTYLALTDTLITWSGFSSSSAVRAICNQPYDLLREVMRQLLNQPYSLNHKYIAMLSQVWSSRLLAMCRQNYGNMPVKRARFNQIWGSSRRLRAMAYHEYGDMPHVRAAFEQVFHLRGGVRAKLEQRWDVSEKAVRALFEAIYELKDKDVRRAMLDQLWVMAAGEAIVQRTAITVTAEIDGATRELTSMLNINDEMDEGLAWMVGELQLADQEEYLFCKHLRTTVTNTVDGEPVVYIVVDPTVARNESGKVYVVPLKSKTILLEHAESEYSRIDEQELSGMRKELVEMLAAPVTTVDWRLANTFLPPGVVQVNGRSRMAIVKEIVDSLGGIVQTSPSGVLICRKDYPVPVNKWKMTEPDVELTDQDDLFQVSPQADPRPGYNKYMVSNNQVSGDDLRIEEVEVSSREKIVRVSMVPWRVGKVILHHSGGPWVQVIDEGPIEELVSEQIEIVGGSGNLPKTCYGINDVAWRYLDLEELTSDEAGAVTSSITGNSLALVGWWTKYYQFRVINDRSEDVQAWPEVLDV